MAVFYSLTEMMMGDEGITSMSKSLKTNTTLTELDLTGEKEDTQKTE